MKVQCVHSSLVSYMTSILKVPDNFADFTVACQSQICITGNRRLQRRPYILLHSMQVR